MNNGLTCCMFLETLSQHRTGVGKNPRLCLAQSHIYLWSLAHKTESDSPFPPISICSPGYSMVGDGSRADTETFRTGDSDMQPKPHPGGKGLPLSLNHRCSQIRSRTQYRWLGLLCPLSFFEQLIHEWILPPCWQRCSFCYTNELKLISFIHSMALGDDPDFFVKMHLEMVSEIIYLCQASCRIHPHGKPLSTVTTQAWSYPIPVYIVRKWYWWWSGDGCGSVLKLDSFLTPPASSSQGQKSQHHPHLLHCAVLSTVHR